MKIVLWFLITALMFIGCNSKATDVEVTPKLVVGKSLADLKLDDQHEKPYLLDKTTKKVIFAFSKDVGHKCNTFFETKKDSYLKDNNTIFVADISGAPSLIRSMFILPGLKDFKHQVLIIDDKVVANNFKANQNVEKIVVVTLDNGIIKKINSFDTIDGLDKEIKKDK